LASFLAAAKWAASEPSARDRRALVHCTPPDLARARAVDSRPGPDGSGALVFGAPAGHLHSQVLAEAGYDSLGETTANKPLGHERM
jgi:hypothetical protein